MVDKWVCKKCTLENHRASQKCCMCNYSRSALNIYDIAPSSGTVAASVWKCDVCTFVNADGNAKCTMCTGGRGACTTTAASTPVGSGGAPPPPSSQSNKWTCSRCTYDNFTRSMKCSLCLELRPSSPSPEDATLATSAASSVAVISTPTSVDKVARSPRNLDRLWMTACRQIIESDSTSSVITYLSSGGDAKRKISKDESTALHFSFAYNCTLSLLALRFHRSKVLECLMPICRPKRVPSHVSPRLSGDLLAYVSNTVKQRKDDFPCYFVTECPTFFLPQDINELTISAKKQLFDDLIDTDVQKELEVEDSIINWTKELYEILNSKLYALWNRSSGNCLLDSILQVTLGIFDTNDSMRKILADTLTDASNIFYEKWATNEQLQAQLLDYCITDNQLRKEWKNILNIARQPGSSLEQIHIFAMSHVLRRPIIVYGIKYVKSYHGEDIGLARFQGVYLPLLWDKSFCWSNPVVLGYTRGHFSALVCISNQGIDRHRNRSKRNKSAGEETSSSYMPLIDSKGDFLDICYLPVNEIDKSEEIFNKWMDCHVTRDGVLVAKQNQTQFSQSRVVKTMLDEWILSYHDHTGQSSPHPSTSHGHFN